MGVIMVARAIGPSPALHQGLEVYSSAELSPGGSTGNSSVPGLSCWGTNAWRMLARPSGRTWAPRGSPCTSGSRPVGPAGTACGSLRELSSLPWASALQEVDDTSSSEGSTVDCPDPEEMLRKIPELADDLEEPEDCFTEGKGAAGASWCWHSLGPEPRWALP